jgi:tetratricopeptide (TPR) repeat protein
MTRRLLLPLFFAGALLTHGVGAQTLDSFEWVPGATPPVARLTFTANVRFLRQAPASTTAVDLSQVGVQIVAGDEKLLTQTVEEGRRLPVTAGRPGVEITYLPLAQTTTKLLTLRFSEKVALQVRQGPGPRSIDLEIAPAATLEQNRLPAMAEIEADRHFAVVLQTFSKDAASKMPRVPAEFQDYAVSTRPTATGSAGVTGNTIDLVLGYFKTAADAERVRQRAAKNFPTATVLSLDKPAIVQAPVVSAPPLVVAAPAIPSAPLAVQPSAASATIDVPAKAREYLDRARQSLSVQRFQDAVDTLNQALLLPPNPYSPAMQELIGSAWEGLNSPDKARLEYQLYLKLYPQSEAAGRVAQRLQVLDAMAKTAKPAAGSAAEAKPKYSATGSISQYYYGGNTKTDSLVNIAAGIDQNTLTRTNQSVIVSSWDATARYQGDESETKLIMRGSRSDNLLSSSTLNSTTQGLISAAYVDYRDLKSRLDVRAGRQSAIGGSMFGLFDGVSAAMPFGDGYKVDAMLGVPANQLVSAPQQVMAGVMLEADNLFDHWGGNVSLMEQTTESISDRRAVGMEVRYFGDVVSVFTQLDYEINLRALNAFTLQGSVQGPADTTFTLLLDDRKAPSLQLSDALISSGQTSLATLLQLKSLNQVQQDALATAAQARQAMVSVSRPLSPKWQGSMDLRYSEIGALPAVGTFQAQPATGAQYNVSFQLTGSNLYSSRDINGFNVSYITSDTLSGTQFAYNNLTGIWDNKASLEPSIRFYTQSDNTGTQVTRVSPGMRMSYKLSNRASVMGEGIYEQSQTDGPTNHETSSSMYFYVGYRYDFQ